MKIHFYILIAIVGFFSCKSNNQSEKSEVVIEKPKLIVAGSETLLPLVKKLSARNKKLSEQYSIDVIGGGSVPAIVSLQTGAADVAMASYKISDSLMQIFKSKQLELNETLVAYDQIDVIVHNHNPVGKLTIEQIDMIFLGKIKNWKEVGGENLKIIVYTRDSKSGTYDFFNENILNGLHVDPSARILPSNEMMLQKISQHKDAIGYIGGGSLDATVKAIGISSDDPRDVNHYLDENFSKSAIIRPLFFYYLKSNEAKVKPLIDFILSEEGQILVSQSGYITKNQ